MTRAIPSGLATLLAQDTTTLAWALRLERADGVVYGFTSADADATISSVLYRSAPGLDVRSLAHSAGLGVDNTEVTILADDAFITRDDIAAGRWDGAAVRVFQYNWASVADGVLVHLEGKLGNISPRGEAYTAELRDLRQALQTDYTVQTQETCRYRFCDVPATGVPSHCRLDAVDFTENITVTAVASQTQFTDTARTEATDTFTYGLLTWTSGLNDGLSVQVRSHTTGGVFALAMPMVYAIEVGDTATVLQGCAKTRAACIDYANILNFGGEPDKPAVNDLTATPDY